MNPRFERSATFWLRAYPPRWRVVRGGEVFGLLADLAGPDDDRLSSRTVVDLVRSGWATRWREHPPLHIWFLYRFFDRRIPAVHRGWAADDIDGVLHPVRRYLASVWVLPLIWAVSVPPGNSASYAPYGWMIGAAGVASLVLWPNYHRRQARLKHLVPQPGEPLAQGVLVGQEVPGVRVEARSALRWTVPVLGLVAGGSVLSALVAPKEIQVIPLDRATWEIVVGPIGTGRAVALTVLGAALLAGLRLAVVVQRRLRRWLPERTGQPYRTLRRLSRTGRVNVVLATGVLCAQVWAEVTGRLALFLGVPLGVAAVLLLPAATVALTTIRRSDPADVDDLAGHDVWWTATRGRVPTVDRPSLGLRPLAGPVPDGAVVPPRRLGDPPYPVLQ